MTQSSPLTSEICIYFKQFANQYANVAGAESQELLDLIMAPPDLQGLFLVLKKLPDILSLAKDINEQAGNIDDLSFKLEAVVEISNKLLDHFDQFKKNLILDSLMPIEGEEIEKQLFSKLESNPLYCCLALPPATSDDKEHIQKHRIFLSYIFLATHNLPARYRDDIKKLKNNFHAVRILCNPEHAQIISSLPNEILAPQAYFEKLRSLEKSKLLTDAVRILKLSLLSPKTPNKTTIRTKPLKPKFPADPEDTERNSAVLWTGNKNISNPALSPEEEIDYINHGGSEKELTSGRDQIPVPCPVNRRFSHITRRDLAIQAKQRSNHLALTNQLNPLSWDELNQFDISILAKIMLGQEEAGTPIAQRILLGIIFFACIPLDRASRLPLFQSNETDESSPEGIYWSKDQTPFIRLRSPGPKLRPKTRLVTSKLAHKVIYYSHIPLSDFFCDVIEKHISHRLNSTKPTILIDPTQIEQTSIDLKKIFSSINSRYGCRLSFSRIQRFFVYGLSREPKEDIPSSMLFFGQPPEMFIARMHYTCAPLHHLEHSYRYLVTSTFSEILLPVSFRAQNPVNPDARLGTPHCPKPEAVQSLVKSMITVLDQTRPRKTNNFNIVKNFHNHYAIYTTCLIAFSTCYRAIHDPSFEEREIHFQSGLGIISDKDDKTRYHSRMVAIPAVCQMQIRHYRMHLNNLYDYFSQKSPAIFNLFKNYCSPGTPLNLFYLTNDDRKIVILKPANLSPYLAEKPHSYDLPPNANRHYIKNELQERGCSPEIYETQLGHWETGQEPWNRFSHLDPVVFSEQLQIHLSAILERDGWIPIEGISQ